MRISDWSSDVCSSDLVADLAHGLAGDLLKAYPVPLAPARVPDFARGETLFVENCASCHGAAGDGHGPDADKLDNPQIAFSAFYRALQRDPFAQIGRAARRGRGW